MARDRARSFQQLDYIDPRHALIELRKLEIRMVLEYPNTPYKVRSLRTNELKPAREARTACLFCYGMGQVLNQQVAVAPVEGQDYDAVAQTPDRFVPIQLKEVVPAQVNPSATLQAEIEKLSKYVDSDDLTVVMYLNRLVSFAQSDLRIPSGLRIAALYVMAAVSPDQSEWGIWGDLLTGCRYGSFLYPTEPLAAPR